MGTQRVRRDFSSRRRRGSYLVERSRCGCHASRFNLRVLSSRRRRGIQMCSRNGCDLGSRGDFVSRTRPYISCSEWNRHGERSRMVFGRKEPGVNVADGVDAADKSCGVSGIDTLVDSDEDQNILVGCATSAPDGSSPRGYAWLLVVVHKARFVMASSDVIIQGGTRLGPCASGRE